MAEVSGASPQRTARQHHPEDQCDNVESLRPPYRPRSRIDRGACLQPTADHEHGSTTDKCIGKDLALAGGFTLPFEGMEQEASTQNRPSRHNKAEEDSEKTGVLVADEKEAGAPPTTRGAGRRARQEIRTNNEEGEEKSCGTSFASLIHHEGRSDINSTVRNPRHDDGPHTASRDDIQKKAAAAVTVVGSTGAAPAEPNKKEKKMLDQEYFGVVPTRQQATNALSHAPFSRTKNQVAEDDSSDQGAIRSRSAGSIMRSHLQRNPSPRNHPRRNYQFPVTRPGAVHIGLGPGEEDDGTIVIGGDTVVVPDDIAQQSSMPMGPLPASLVQENERTTEAGNKHICSSRMSGRKLVLWFLFVLVAIGTALGLGIGLSQHFKTDDDLALNGNPSSPPATAAVVATKWTMIGQPNDIVGSTDNDWLGFYVAISGDGRTIAAATFPASARDPYVLVAFSVGANFTQPIGGRINNPGSALFGWGISLSHNGKLTGVGSRDNGFIYRLQRNEWDEAGGLFRPFRGGYRPVLSADGSTAVVGVHIVQAYRYNFFEDEWSEIGQPLAGNEEPEYFGYESSLSANGRRLAIGLPGSNNSTGRVRVFDLVQDGEGVFSWSQTGMDILGISPYDVLGHSVSLSDDGQCVAVGAMQNRCFHCEEPEFTSFTRPGYVGVYCLEEDDGTDEWLLRGQKLLGPSRSWFGYSVDLSGDGRTLVVGAPGYNEGDVLIGQVSIFRFQGNLWIQQARFEEMGPQVYGCGWSVSVSSNGSVVVVGCPGSYVSGGSLVGVVRVLRELPCDVDEEEDSSEGVDSNITPCNVQEQQN